MLLVGLCRMHGLRQRNVLRRSWPRNAISSHLLTESPNDELITGLNAPQDIMVKVISCRELIQETMTKGNLSSTASRALAEGTRVCVLKVSCLHILLFKL
jgi:hypothetical protein